MIDSTSCDSTVMVQVALTPLPSWARALMWATPGLTANTSPMGLTVATDVLSLLQKTVLLSASTGRTVAVSCRCQFVLQSMVADVRFSVMLFTNMLLTTPSWMFLKSFHWDVCR